MPAVLARTRRPNSRVAHIHQPPRQSSLDHQLFRLSLETIFNAYVYGHLEEAAALRLIARGMRQQLT